MRKVGTMVSRQRVVVNGRDGAGVGIFALNQNSRRKGKNSIARETCEKATVAPFIRKRLSVAEYTYRRALQINKKGLSYPSQNLLRTTPP